MNENKKAVYISLRELQKSILEKLKGVLRGNTLRTKKTNKGKNEGPQI